MSTTSLTSQKYVAKYGRYDKFSTNREFCKLAILMYSVSMTLHQLYIIYSLAGLVVVLIAWVIRLEVKLHRLTRGADGKSLEASILDMHKKMEQLHEFRADSLAYFGDVERRLNKSVQAVETVRFNPFHGTGDGGNQSFSTAFVSEHGDGVVLTSLYSRDRISVFSKPLKKFASSFELSGEEKQVVDEAKKKIS